jgi:hypothetical protein
MDYWDWYRVQYKRNKEMESGKETEVRYYSDFLLLNQEYLFVLAFALMVCIPVPGGC